MSNADERLLELLRRAEKAKVEAVPDRNSLRTDDCPPIGMYARYAREGWGDKAQHARDCQYCQNRRAGFFQNQCPGWKTLHQYLSDEEFVDRLAVKRHLDWQGCGACAAKLAVMKSLRLLRATHGGWVCVRWQPDMAAAYASDDSRDPVWIPIRVENPEVEVTITEVAGGIQMDARTRDAGCAGKTVDVRITGPTTEVRVPVEFMQETGEWAARARVPCNEEQLKELSGEVYVSVLVRDSVDEESE